VEVTLCNPNNCNATVGVLLGNGDGTFQPVQTIDLGSVFAISVAVADLNGDGTFQAAQTYDSGFPF
jgi:FG-GAP-like repeat